MQPSSSQSLKTFQTQSSLAWDRWKAKWRIEYFWELVVQTHFIATLHLSYWCFQYNSLCASQWSFGTFFVFHPVYWSSSCAYLKNFLSSTLFFFEVCRQCTVHQSTVVVNNRWSDALQWYSWSLFYRVWLPILWGWGL